MAMMPATDAIEDLHPLKAVDVSLSCNSNSCLSLPIPTEPSDSCKAVIENRTVSMANNDCNKALSSPAEASPAKPASASPATVERTVDTSPATSHIASAADSLPCEGSDIISMTKHTASTVAPSTLFGNGVETDFSARLTFKGVTVTLENNNVWNDFYGCGTEMILTRQGRHMFPFCRYRITGLEPERKYSLVLSVVPSDANKYRWSSKQWEVTGPAEHLSQSGLLIRAFAHHYSPCRGTDWMNFLVSFKKVKLTNNPHDQEGNLILHSMHRYIPRLHVIPVLDGVAPTADQPVVMGPESMTFTFPQTEFMAVTTYQNFRITQMKIQYNPFAKGFRDDGNNPRLKRINREIELVNVDTAGTSATIDEVEDVCAKKDADVQGMQIILKPIMSSMSSEDNVYVPCRGKHALGNLVLVQKRPAVEPTKEQNRSMNLTLPVKLCVTVHRKGRLKSSLCAPRLLPKYHKKRKRLKRHWGYARRKEWKTVASPTVAHRPPLTVAMQPELDDVEGLLFVSFTSKAGLQCHVGDRPVKSALSESSSSQTPVQLQLTVETEIPESDEEKIVHFEANLLQDLRGLKHRQAIHPVLQEVGLKLSSLDPTQSVDLQYLGVQVPLPHTKLPEQGNALDSLAGDPGLPFISRTGKTSDMTKIKGWRNKFIRSKDRSSNSDGEKKLSAFCSNMLDEYLESEAQQITERAAAFSMNPPGSVAYQLPAKSSSYVKTLDSVLKQRNPPTNISNKPCPLSCKPFQKSASASPASAASPVPDEVQSIQQPTALNIQPSTASGLHQNSTIIHRLSKYLPEIKNKLSVTPEGSKGLSFPTAGLSKPQVKLFEMELGASNQGLHRTQLAEDRLTVALSALVTKWSQLHDVLKIKKYPKVSGPACGLEFCRLGCICQSIQNLHKGPFHCGRSECVLGCSCFKRKITKHLAMEVTKQHTSPSYSMKTMGIEVEPHSKSHLQKLWIKNIHDSDEEPLFIPNQTKNFIPTKTSKPFTALPTIREEDKDPVYKFLESRLTCARVREFNSKPPPVETFEDFTAPMNLTKPEEKLTDKLLTKPHTNIYLLKKTVGQAVSGSAPCDKQSRTLIEIQSACQWSGDRKMVLEALCLNMNRNKLCQPLSVGPYRIRPVAKIVMQKPTGSIITYRVRISLRSNGNDSNDCDSDDSDVEKQNKSFEEDIEENCREFKKPQFSVDVTPFLIGALPAGVLTAKTAPVGFQASGLIQVNGKSYNHARLMLGRMGSLHPANRLAAHVAGRLGAPSNGSNKVSDSSKSSLKTITHLRAVIKATSTTPKMAAPPTVRALQPDTWKTGTIHGLTQPPKSISAVKPMQPSVSCKHSSAGPLQSSSPVSLTVSPALKTPSFLGQRGTYSFRICPPDSEDTTLPGIALPGGFTLIQLPTPGTSGALTQQCNKTHLTGFLSQLICDENKTNSRQMETNMDMASDDTSSDFSDDCDDDDDDDDEVEDISVDVETVEELEQQKIVSTLKTAAGIDTQEFRISSNFNSVMSQDAQEYTRSKHGVKYEKKYTERQRRSEQRVRFDRLQTVLGTDPKAPRLYLLSMAVKEIHNLTEQSNYLEVKKRVLARIKEGHIKKIALLSGKSEMTVMEKLKDVCEKQKQKEENHKEQKQKKEQICGNPSFSSLLQSKASMVQANSSPSKPESIPLLKPVLDVAPALTNQQPTSQNTPDSPANSAEQIKATAKNFLQELLSKLKPIIHKAKSSHQAPATEKQSSAQDLSPLQSLKLLSQAIKYPLPVEEATTVSGSLAASQKDIAKIEALSGTPSSFVPVPQPQPMALPLIRSKDGRIILPSSMKPTGHGFYTFTVMKSNKDGEQGEGNSKILLQPIDADSLKKQEINVSESEHTDSGKQILVDIKSIQPPNSKTERQVLQSPQPNIDHLNKSISSPLTALPSADRTQTGLSQPLATACLTFNPVVRREPFPAPVVRRGRGRPRKYPFPLTSPKPKIMGVVNYVETHRSPEQRKRQAAETTDPHFIPTKRGRGRPSKNKQLSLPRPKVWKAQSSPQSYMNSDDYPYESEMDTFVENATASRPLTRGSLGKDFPSAKRRSWIDVEKELELDIE